MAPFSIILEQHRMAKDVDSEREADGVADAIAVTAIVAIVVFGMYLWLSGLPH